MNAIEQANQAFVTEAAEIVGVKRAALYDAVKRGVIPHKRLPRNKTQQFVVVDLSDVETYFTQSRRPRRDQMVAMHNAGHDPASIAHELGVKEYSVKRALQRARREMCGSTRSQKCKPD